MSATIAATSARPQALAGQFKKLLILASVTLLAACSTIPRGKGPPPVVTADPMDGMHRVALLLPVTGPDADVGQAIANATALALTDTKVTNIRMITYDTGAGVAAATKRAIADGNKLILGPLRGDDVVEVAAQAKPAGVPIISFSNDIGVAGQNVFLLGHLPNQSIERVVRYAQSQGYNRFAGIVSSNVYGQRALSNMTVAVRAAGGTLVAIQESNGTAASADAAARRLVQLGGIEAILIADSGRAASQRPAHGKNSRYRFVEYRRHPCEQCVHVWRVVRERVGHFVHTICGQISRPLWQGAFASFQPWL